MEGKPWWQSTTVMSVVVLVVGAALMIADRITFEQYMALVSVGGAGAALGIRRQLGGGLKKGRKS